MSIAVLFVASLLLIGVAVRQSLRPLRQLFIPSSVIAGFLGLALVSALGLTDNVATNEWVSDLCSTLSGWPGPLISIVFAAMLLQQPGRPKKPDQTAPGRVARQGLMVWIIVLGETMAGLLATWIFIRPYFDVPNSFGMLIETGFAGGHGTAAAMGQVYSSNQVNLPEGLDLGLLMATCGLVYGLVSGIVWINLGIRLGWINQTIGQTETDARDDQESPEDHKKPIGYETLTSDAIDPLLLQGAWIALAFGVGWVMQTVVLGFAGWIDGWIGAGIAAGDAGAQAELSKRLTASNVMDFPLFIYTLFGGWMVRFVLAKRNQLHLVDQATVQRISSTAMEILVVAAIASLKLSAISALLGPFAILFVTGAIWTAICLLLISRWVLPHQHWFQLGLINYGMSTGTTATGFVLLRVIDPELKTDAASDYALAAPLSAPFIGGGILTIALPLIVLEQFPLAWPTLIITAIVIGLVVVGYRSNRRLS